MEITKLCVLSMFLLAIQDFALYRVAGCFCRSWSGWRRLLTGWLFLIFYVPLMSHVSARVVNRAIWQPAVVGLVIVTGSL